jgi:hypothetical protein
VAVALGLLVGAIHVAWLVGCGAVGYLAWQRTKAKPVHRAVALAVIIVIGLVGYASVGELTIDMVRSIMEQ